MRLAEAAALAAQEAAQEAEAAQLLLQDSALAADGAAAASEASSAAQVHQLEQQQQQAQQARLATEKMRLAAAVASATKDGEERAWATASESIAAAQAEAEEASQRAAAAEEVSCLHLCSTSIREYFINEFDRACTISGVSSHPSCVFVTAYLTTFHSVLNLPNPCNVLPIIGGRSRA